MPFHIVPLAKAPTRMAARLSPLLSSAPGNAPNIHDSSNSASSCYSTPSSVAVFDCRPAARLVPRSSSTIFASASFSCSSASFSVSGSTALAGRGLLAFSSPAPAAGAGAGVTDRRPSMTTTTPNASSATAPTAAKSIHDFTVKDINGEEVDLSGYKGKVLLVVNVASACGLTSNNYKELQEVYAGLKESGLEILAFPCNQFGGQEPGSNEQIKEFACTRFKAEYPIFDKVEVNGPNTAPVYQFLKASKGGGILGDSIKWNFAKFLVDQDGIVVERYAPTTSPKRIEDDIRALVGLPPGPCH